jgi:hypothetical protein
MDGPDSEDKAGQLRERLLEIARLREEVFEFRQGELNDVAQARAEAERREARAKDNCNRRVEELADKLTQETIEEEYNRLGDDEEELARLNALRMRVVKQEVRAPLEGHGQLIVRCRSWWAQCARTSSSSRSKPRASATSTTACSRRSKRSAHGWKNSM